MSSPATPQQACVAVETTLFGQNGQRGQQQPFMQGEDSQESCAASQLGEPGHARVTAAITPVAQCKYQCGPPLPLTDLRRSNKKAAWECRACFNAARAIETLARKDQVLKEAHEKLKRDDEAAWHAKVRATRIMPEFGQRGEHGVASLCERISPRSANSFA